MNLNKFSSYYHNAWAILSIIAGIVFTFYTCIKDSNTVSEGIFMALMIVILGTFCFLIYPLIILAIATIIKYAPTLAFPCYLIMAIGNLCGDNNDIGIKSLSISILCSLFGLFNIITRSKIDEKDNHSFLF